MMTPELWKKVDSDRSHDAHICCDATCRTEWFATPLVRVPFDEAKKRGLAAFNDAYYRRVLSIEEVVEAVLRAALGEGTE